jgi:hypothetical protein
VNTAQWKLSQDIFYDFFCCFFRLNNFGLWRWLYIDANPCTFLTFVLCHQVPSDILQLFCSHTRKAKFQNLTIRCSLSDTCASWVLLFLQVLLSVITRVLTLHEAWVNEGGGCRSCYHSVFIDNANIFIIFFMILHCIVLVLSPPQLIVWCHWVYGSELHMVSAWSPVEWPLSPSFRVTSCVRGYYVRYNWHML